MTREYNALEHSVVQALLKPDATQRYEVPAYVEALLFGIYRELEHVYRNWNQESLEDRKDWQLVACGFEYRRYYWGDCDCPGDHHLDTCPPQLPNFKFGPVIFNWYKHMGRGMSTNVDYNEREWREWFDQAMVAVRLYDRCIQVRHQKLRDEAAGRKPFSNNDRVQRQDCKYCLAEAERDSYAKHPQATRHGVYIHK